MTFAPTSTVHGTSQLAWWPRAVARLGGTRRIVLTLILALTIWAPRMIALDRVVTPDEPSWLTNAAAFYTALSQADFGSTYRLEHPGVTTMWIGTLAYLWSYPDYPTDAPQLFPWWEAQRLDEVLAQHGHDPMDILVRARYGMVAVFTLTLLVAFSAAVRLFGLLAACLGFLLIAFDPMYMALSRIMHVDALLSAFMLLSLLSFLAYLAEGRRRDLVVSAVALGLALLTKSPALFLLPFCALLALSRSLKLNGWHWQLARAGIVQYAKPIVLWALIALGVFVVLWPAMWTDPLGNGLWVIRGSSGHAIKGHESPLFFNGTVYEGHPSWSFYPLAYVWRTTPLVIAGLALFAVAHLPVRRRPGTIALALTPAFVLLLFAGTFLIFMSFGAKQFDRYLLPIYGPLDIIAALGWVAAGRWLARRGRALARSTLPAIVAVVAVLQAASAFSTYPYYFSYYNPLLGGNTRAAGVMMIGWGEGLDQAGRFLNRQPDATHLRVATSAWSGTLSYFFDGQALAGRYDVSDADYYVLYVNQVQRRAVPRELVQYLASRRVVLTVTLSGLEYVRVYDLRHQAERVRGHRFVDE